MHYYKRNLGDYAKKAGRLSMLQHGAYTLLMDSCYDREQFPTLEEAIDWTWASSKEEVEAVEFVLKKFFVLQDGVYVQPRIKEEIDAYQAKAETNQRIAQEREEKRRAKMAKRSDSSTNRARTVDESSPPDHEPPPNQEPRTINQEPLKEMASSRDDTGREAAPEEKPPNPEKPKFVAKRIDLPATVDRDNWVRWCEFRSSKRKPISEQAARQQIAMLAEHPPDAQQAIVQNSIQNDYQGLFAPKGGSHAGHQHADKPRSAVDRVRAATAERERQRVLRAGHGSAVGADGRDLRSPLDQRLRGDPGAGVGDCLEGDFTREDQAGTGTDGR